MECEHRFYFEPAKQDLNKVIFTKKEFLRCVCRCSKCGKEIKIAGNFEG